MPTATPKANRAVTVPKTQQHESRGFYWHGYKSGRWRREREEYLKANPVCKECERNNRALPAVVVDHVNPIEDGCDPWDRDNWQGLCLRDDASKRGKTKRKRK